MKSNSRMYQWMKGAALVAALTMTGLTAANAAPLTQVASRDGGFTINMPAQASDEVTTLANGVELHQFTATEGDAAYIVGYSTIGYDVSGVSNDDTFDTAISGALEAINGHATSTQDFSSQGFPARQAKGYGTKNGINFVMTYRVYRVGNRLYQVMLVSPSNEAWPSDATDFFNSFRFTN